MDFSAREHISLMMFNQEIQIRYYGIIIVTAMLIAAWIGSRLAERTGRDSDHIWGALTWAIFPGIIFARLWWITFPPLSQTQGCGPDVIPGSLAVCKDAAYFYSNFFNLTDGAIAVWSGGLHIYGAVIGGLLGLWLYFGPLHNRVAMFFHYIFLPIAVIFDGIAWIFTAILQRIGDREVTPFEVPKFKTDFPNEGIAMRPWLDIAGVVLPLAQAIGRWANFINQELYGTPTDLPWGIPIDAANRIPPYTVSEYSGNFHPLFFYEAAWNFIAFLVLYNLYTRNRDSFQAGDFFLLYLAQYSFIRFFLEFIRIDVAVAYGFNTSQVLAAVVFLGALGIFFMRRNSNTADSYEASVPQTGSAEASA